MITFVMIMGWVMIILFVLVFIVKLNMVSKNATTQNIVSLLLATFIMINSVVSMVTIYKLNQRPEVIEKEIPVEVVVEKEVEKLISVYEFLGLEELGEFYTTGYCACEVCCDNTDGITSSGVKATPNITIACDPSKIPYGTILYIEGVGLRVAHDKPSEGALNRYGGMLIDVMYSDHESALDHGVQKLRVWRVNG